MLGSFVKIYPNRRLWLHVIPLEYLSTQFDKPLKTPTEPEMAADVSTPIAAHIWLLTSP